VKQIQRADALTRSSYTGRGFDSQRGYVSSPMSLGQQVATASQIRVLTVDDHPFLREGVVAIIREEADMVVVGEASNGREAIEAFRGCRPDVTLMDLQLPELNGIDAISAIRGEHPSARIIVLTTYDGDVRVRRALMAGAAGYILKSMIRKELILAIRAVHAGRKFIPQQIAIEVAGYFEKDDLSAREIEVLRAVAEGKSNKIIADQLSITETTVKAHMKSILLKLGASDRTHAVVIATNRGFLA
jgi:DNA-binding NarL/FixJ family response regulator